VIWLSRGAQLVHRVERDRREGSKRCIDWRSSLIGASCVALLSFWIEMISLVIGCGVRYNPFPPCAETGAGAVGAEPGSAGLLLE
jgi:hypothetical protein